MFRRVAATTAAAVCLLALASMIVPSRALSCGVESQNCPALAYCENITVNGVYQPTCVCPPGTIGSEDYTSNKPPFTSGPTCNKDLWTVRYVKKHTAWGEWRVCGASNTIGSANHGAFTCNQCVGELRYGRDDQTAANRPGPWWTYKAAPTTNSILACTKAQFGIAANANDPYPNEYKSCDCRKLVELPFAQWTKCAEEHGECTCAGTVRYGSDRFWSDITSNGNSPVACDNYRNGWGDPHVNTYKACYCFAGVYQTLIPGFNRTLSENPSAIVSADSGFAMCEEDSKGYYLRKVGDTLEVNCLYENKTKAEQEVGEYSDPTYTVAPRVYRWVLPTTAEPIEIPPTGVTVDSVNFDTTCAASGCWVIKGTMTTGEAFNDFSVFNTFFLPQATVPNNGSISYDFDYSATGSNVDWTFQPANHPCSSADYKAGVTPNIFKISYCCVSEPTVTPTNVPNQKGGFVANYRPTQNFVNWADQHSKACDLKFRTADGGYKCWKKFSDTLDTADQANARCIVAGGTLPTIANATENNLFKQLFTSTSGNAVLSGTTWLGLKDSLREAGNVGNSLNWQWADGSSSTYRNWAGGEPNNYINRGAFGEDCVEFRSDGLWNDESCGTATKLYKYVCQFTDEQACRKTVIQRPKYSAPPQMTAPCWKVVKQAMNYTSGQAHCVKMGGNLALVDSPEKFHLMKRMLDADRQNVQQAWIGLDDMATEKVFKWIISGETMMDPGNLPNAGASYFQGWRSDCHHTSCSIGRGYPSSWADNQTHLNLFGPTADCAAVTDLGRWWQDFPCSETKVFVCEVPRPTDEDDLGQCDSFLPNLDTMWNMPFPVNYNSFMTGKFKGMPVSPGVVSFVNLDPYFGQFSFEVRLDEVELRNKAGQLRGTVGVEHTVDTFLGLSSFRPTGLANGVLDTFSTQTNLHFEKTSFFTVSTHGVNDYTFLEYVNMRLISVYTEDKNFTGNNNAVTERTSSAGNLNYVQVTFTLGAAYTVNNNPNPDPYASGLIPLDSVRTGRGTFFSDVEDADGLEHTCQEYVGASNTDYIGLSVGKVEKKTFDDGIAQSCGPQSTMCASPASVPDQFVSFNIPLGSEVFDDQADSTLSNNIFVSLVVNALKPSSSIPNSGGEPQQMKTTLTASIPIVAGGINIFCDGVTAKTDLKDVADVDIIVGSASSGAELTRLRIMQNIGSTDLSTVEPSEINTDSIEAALMTLVLKGNHSYFRDGNTNTMSYTMELDDVITLHLMEDGAATSTNSKETEVLRLLAIAGDDNSDLGTGTLDTDGYALNGAFYFTIDRAANKAHLEPSEALLNVCPLNPPRPAPGSAPLESCILRRDVRNRGYPYRVGASRTAMEVLASSVPSKNSEKSHIDVLATNLATSSDESTFLAGILGDSDFSKDLAVKFAKAIHQRYELNGRYRRAYWINPGYEWTPTQTAGKSIFSVSQKLYLFALISQDENWQRRRVLLQSSTDALADSSAGVNGAAFSFQISPKSMLADAYQVPEDRVAVFDVEVALTQPEACMPLTDLQAELRESLGDILATTASAYYSVQVTQLERNLNGVVCPSRRALRKLLASEALSQATGAAQMLVVFTDTEGKPRFNHVAFASSPRIAGFAPDQRNAVDYDANFVCKDGECGPKTSNSAGSTPADNEKEEGSESKTAIIAGVAGGVGGALLVAVGVVLFMKQRKPDAPVAAVQSINVDDLKHQLSQGV